MSTVTRWRVGEVVEFAAPLDTKTLYGYVPQGAEGIVIEDDGGDVVIVGLSRAHGGAIVRVPRGQLSASARFRVQTGTYRMLSGWDGEPTLESRATEARATSHGGDGEEGTMHTEQSQRVRDAELVERQRDVTPRRPQKTVREAVAEALRRDRPHAEVAAIAEHVAGEAAREGCPCDESRAACSCAEIVLTDDPHDPDGPPVVLRIPPERQGWRGRLAYIEQVLAHGVARYDVPLPAQQDAEALALGARRALAEVRSMIDGIGGEERLVECPKCRGGWASSYAPVRCPHCTAPEVTAREVDGGQDVREGRVPYSDVRPDGLVT